jgi:hypothetical protein
MKWEMKNKEGVKFFTLRLSPESYELHLRAGLLTRSGLSAFPFLKSEQWQRLLSLFVAFARYFVPVQITILELTATGIAPDSHRVPF